MNVASRGQRDMFRGSDICLICPSFSQADVFEENGRIARRLRRAAKNVDGPANRVPLASFGEGFDLISSVAASDDGQRVFISSKSSGTVTIVDLATGLSSALPCNCQTSGLFRLKGNSVFRLSDLSDRPVALLDASSPAPRVIVIPPREAQWIVLRDAPETVLQKAIPQ